MSAINQRDQALSILDSKLSLLSELYKECCLSMGRGALLVYARNVIERGLPNKHDYRSLKMCLLYDGKLSRTVLRRESGSNARDLSGKTILEGVYK